LIEPATIYRRIIVFAEQVTAEYFVRTEGRSPTADEWKARHEQPDHYKHWSRADGLSAATANSPDVRRTLQNRSLRRLFAS